MDLQVGRFTWGGYLILLLMYEVFFFSYLISMSHVIDTLVLSCRASLGMEGREIRLKLGGLLKYDLSLFFP